MAEPVSSIRNLGPASDESFARAGLTSAEDVRALGADETYRRLISAGTRPHFIGYYALVMGLQGRPWNDCQGQEKADLRARFDAIKASTKSESRPEMEAALNVLGVVPKRQPTSSRPEKK